MATKEAIAIMREKAIKRLAHAAGRMADPTGVNAPELPLFRDPAYQEAAQLDALAAYVEQVATALVGEEIPELPPEKVEEILNEVQAADMSEPPPADAISPAEQANVASGDEIVAGAPVGDVLTSYDDSTVPELREMAERRGIDLEGATRKAEIIFRLVEADVAALADESQE